MPINRLDPDKIVKKFAKYGHTILTNNFKNYYRNVRQNFTVRDNVTNRVYTTNYNSFMQRVRRGRITKVDPFIHALNDTNTLQLDYHTRMDKQIKKFATTQVSYFLHEPRDIQLRSIRRAKTLKQEAMLAQDVTIVNRHDKKLNKVNLFAFINTLYTIAKSKLHNKYRMVIEVVWNDIYSYFYINENTIRMLNNVIENLYYGQPLQQLTDSTTAAMFSIRDWDTMSIRFYQKEKESDNILDAPKRKSKQRNTGSFWRYLNNTDIDLSPYGIFKEFNQTNYKYSCFVYALQQSKQFTNAELDLINDSINTIAFPCDCIKKICELFDVSITVSKYSPTMHKINKTKQYGNKNSNKHVKLLLRDNHYMLNEPLNITPYYLKHMHTINNSPRVNKQRLYQVKHLSDSSVSYNKNPKVSINQLIDIFFENNYFSQLTTEQTFNVLNQNKYYDFTNLDYCDKCVRPTTYKQQTLLRPYNSAQFNNDPTTVNPVYDVIYTTNIEEFANSPYATVTKYKSAITKITTANAVIRNSKLLFMFDPTDDELQQLQELFQNKFDINFFSYDTLSQIGDELMHKYNCYQDVPQLAGKPAVFIKQCAPKVCLQTAFKQPQNISGNLVQIDKNGSYSATYTQFSGIPKGTPKVITNFTPEQYDYYYILININSYSCKHNEDRFPLLLNTGELFVDKNMFDFITEHYNIDYTFISGYYFNNGFNNNIRTLANDLYNLRLQLKANNSRIESVIKSILSLLWGKAQINRSIIKQVPVNKNKLDDFTNYNHNFIYKSEQLNNDTTMCSLLKPVTLHYTRPQFATNVLSHARTTLNNIFYYAADNNIPIYYSNTDSLVLDKHNLTKLNVSIGKQLGQFKVERDNITHIIYLTAKKYLQVTEQDTIIKGCGKRVQQHNAIKYFTKHYNKLMREY